MNLRHTIFLLFVMACGGATTGVGESAPPGGSGDGSGGSGSGASSTSSSSSSGGSSTSSSSTSSSSSSSSGSTTTCNPTSIAPTQTVTLRLTNTGSTERWIGTRGNWCDAIAVSRAGKRLAQSLTFQCVCECPNPGDVNRVSDFVRIAPGATVDVAWPAVEIDACTEAFDCKTAGWDTGMAQRWISGGHPAPAGAMHVEMPVEKVLPDGCNTNGDKAWCDVGFGGGSGSPMIPAGGLATACNATSTAAADFTLPASGDIVVAISVP